MKIGRCAKEKHGDIGCRQVRYTRIHLHLSVCSYMIQYSFTRKNVHMYTINLWTLLSSIMCIPYKHITKISIKLIIFVYNWNNCAKLLIWQLWLVPVMCSVISQSILLDVTFYIINPPINFYAWYAIFSYVSYHSMILYLSYFELQVETKKWKIMY